jgi:hemolysin III
MYFAWYFWQLGEGRRHWRIGGLAFSISAVFLLAMSGIYHALYPGEWKDFFQRLDYAGIFALITGTFTAIHVVYFKGWWRWGMISIVGGLSLVSMLIHLFFWDSIHFYVSLGIYLVIGWMGFFSFLKLRKTVDPSHLRYGSIGGVIYTVGTVFMILEQPIFIPGWFGHHEIWHLFVLGGLTAHLLFVLQGMRSR